MANIFANVTIPFIVFFIILFGLYKKTDVFESFILGVEENLKVGIKILPSLIALMVAIGVLKSSGLLEFITNLIFPISKMFNIPSDIIPQAILRPISNSGSLVLFKEILAKNGPDSFVSRVSSILQGSSETTFYVVAIYYGAINIKNIRYTLPCALIGDFVCFVSSLVVAYLLF